MKDIFGQALFDYYHNKFTPPLLLHNEYGEPDEIPIERYFIKEGEYSALEVYALEHFAGKILDIGSATGRHVLHLQGLGYDITAMDISHSCGKLMHEMGVDKVIIDDIYNFSDYKYDTISMLMNGIMNKIKTLAARGNSGRNFLRFSCCQNKNNVFRGFFKRFKQTIRGVNIPQNSVRINRCAIRGATNGNESLELSGVAVEDRVEEDVRDAVRRRVRKGGGVEGLGSRQHQEGGAADRHQKGERQRRRPTTEGLRHCLGRR